MNTVPITIGVDIGIRRDTAALVAVARHPGTQKFYRYGHRIFEPPVHIPHVTDFLLQRINTDRVVGIFYDEYQFVSEVQRLIDDGYERIMYRVDQQGMSPEFSNCLHGYITRGDYWQYTDPQVRGQYTWAAADITERGFRIVKRKQSRPIDGVVAEAMALWGAVQNFSYMMTDAYDEAKHTVALEDLP